MIWILGPLVFAVFLAVAYPVTFVLTALVAHLFDIVGRSVAVPWRRGATLPPPEDVHHSLVRSVLAAATVFFVILCTPLARERLGPVAVISQSLFYAALLIAFAEWLEARSARPAVWVCFGGMTQYAFFFGANAFGRVAIPASFDAFACVGFLALAMRAVREDDRARRTASSDPEAVSSD